MGKYTKNSQNEWIEKIYVTEPSVVIITADPLHKPKYTVHNKVGAY